jgi:hypothetical protein
MKAHRTGLGGTVIKSPTGTRFFAEGDLNNGYSEQHSSPTSSVKSRLVPHRYPAETTRESNRNRWRLVDQRSESLNWQPASGTDTASAVVDLRSLLTLVQRGPLAEISPQPLPDNTSEPVLLYQKRFFQSQWLGQLVAAPALAVYSSSHETAPAVATRPPQETASNLAGQATWNHQQNINTHQ